MNNYSDEQVERFEQAAYESATGEAGKEWNREHSEHDYQVHLLHEQIAELESDRRWINHEPNVEGAYLVEAVRDGQYDYRVEWFLDGDWVELDKKYFSRYFNMLLIDNVDGTPQAPELPEVTQ